MRRQRTGIGNIDWVSFSLYLALVFIGTMMIYAATYDPNTENMGNIMSKQFMWIGVSMFILFLTLILDWKFWRTFAYPIYIFAMCLLVLVLFFGIKIKGATSWFSLFGFSFQPSELAKFGTCLALSSFLSAYDTNLKDFKSQIQTIAIIGVPIGLILLQPDAGSAIVFLSFFILLYREGFSSRFFIISGSLGVILILSFIYPPLNIIHFLLVSASLFLTVNLKDRMRWFLGLIALTGLAIYAFRLGYELEAFIGSLIFLLLVGVYQYSKGNFRMVIPLVPLLLLGAGGSFASNYLFKNLKSHQQERINVWLQPEKTDIYGSGYNLFHSKLAIGSGGLKGKGFLHGTHTQLRYVPEQETDFIFCTIGEEQGFIGSFGIIALFVLLLYRIVLIAERQRSEFSRHFAYGVAGIIFTHFFINIGMTMGLAPVVGIPLPFISYGGSSILGFTLLIGVLLKLDSNRYSV